MRDFSTYIIKKAATASFVTVTAFPYDHKVNFCVSKVYPTAILPCCRLYNPFNDIILR